MEQVLIKSGNECAALAVLHSGISVAYSYPGTPSTEIMADLIKNMTNVKWNANEKTALEAALGVSYVGGRSFVSMKHVGLNVAADPFLSGANMNINGGIVIVVADDPGMHSSQNEQDTRYYADFARTLCLEPSTVQETYDMIRDGFELSEKFHKIVVVRMCTRLSHSKGKVVLRDGVNKKLLPPVDFKGWNSVPNFSRKNWTRTVETFPAILANSENSEYNYVENMGAKKGVITTGLGVQYFKELNLDMPHFHIGCYPIPENRLEAFLQTLNEVYIIEEGYPYVERFVRGIISTGIKIYGKLDNTFNQIGELTPDIVAKVFGVENNNEPLDLSIDDLPPRPPQLCKGCPHADTYTMVKEVFNKYPDLVINADIGCYSLGALPPFSLPITLVDMGAAIPMAKGAADCGKKSIAIIGDSTFIHSGLTGVVDCVNNSTPTTIIVLDNSVTAMTGGQPQILPSENLPQIVEAIGVEKEHIHTIIPLPNNLENNVKVLEEEINYNGVSVIFSKRECIEALRKAAKQKKGQ